ncbi:RNA polymerase sigma factor [Sulfobacillus thermosulfidooxidans]|uniref:RNA polymerase sigma factor n=1 Tax=Sulfobacillus thermosulfidooxidans TaxID=28034 RepID=UPI0006B60AD0|nr:sigma-70 family RNA polymerase sigma factor [Sulfobacillus thermosulfidooxidans]
MHHWDGWCTAVDASIRRYCQQRIPEQDVEDVVQEIWVKLFDRSVAHLNAILEGNGQGYVMGIAKHTVADYWRKQRTENRFGEELALSPANDVVDKEFEQEIRLLVTQLPDSLQALTREWLFADVTLEDLARVYHLPVGTVKSRLHQARQLLQRRVLSFPNNEGPSLFSAPSRILSDRERALWQWLIAKDADIRITWAVRVNPQGSIWLDIRVVTTKMTAVPQLFMRWPNLGWPRRLVTNTRIYRSEPTSSEAVWHEYQVNALNRPVDLELSFFLPPQKAQQLDLVTMTRSGFYVGFETIPVSSPPHNLRISSHIALVLPSRWRAKSRIRKPEQHLVVNDRQYLVYQVEKSERLFRTECEAKI